MKKRFTLILLVGLATLIAIAVVSRQAKRAFTRYVVAELEERASSSLVRLSLEQPSIYFLGMRANALRLSGVKLPLPILEILNPRGQVLVTKVRGDTAPFVISGKMYGGTLNADCLYRFQRGSLECKKVELRDLAIAEYPIARLAGVQTGVMAMVNRTPLVIDIESGEAQGEIAIEILKLKRNQQAILSKLAGSSSSISNIPAFYIDQLAGKVFFHPGELCISDLVANGTLGEVLGGGRIYLNNNTARAEIFMQFTASLSDSGVELLRNLAISGVILPSISVPTVFHVSGELTDLRVITDTALGRENYVATQPGCGKETHSISN